MKLHKSKVTVANQQLCFIEFLFSTKYLDIFKPLLTLDLNI